MTAALLDTNAVSDLMRELVSLRSGAAPSCGLTRAGRIGAQVIPLELAELQAERYPLGMVDCSFAR